MLKQGNSHLKSFLNPKKKNPYTYPKKKKDFSNEKLIYYNFQKKRFFQTKKFLYLREKVISLHYRFVSNTVMLFFILENISPFLLVKHFYLPMVNNIFFYILN